MRGNHLAYEATQGMRYKLSHACANETVNVRNARILINKMCALRYLKNLTQKRIKMYMSMFILYFNKINIK